MGRPVRRYFALHGMAVGAVAAWQPENTDADEDEPALWRVVMADGDVEDLEEHELTDALAAADEARGVGGEVDAILEAAWEALEMAVALHTRAGAAEAGSGGAGGAGGAGAGGRELPRAEAHERLGDAAMQNEQPERAKEEYADARLLLHALRDAGALPPDDRRLADIEFFLGLACLRLADAPAARQHYRQALATLRLRRANLQKAQLERQIGDLSQEVAAGDHGGAAGGDADGQAAQEAKEVAEIGELVGEIEGRLRELEA